MKRWNALLLLLALCLFATLLPAPARAKADDGLFERTVFFGDSLTVGLADYAKARRDAGEACLAGAQFLAKIGYKVQDSLQSDAFLEHPLYHNKAQSPFKSLSAMKPKRVFVLLGVNDAFMEVSTVLSNYDAMLRKLRAALPESELVLLALLPMHQSREDGEYSNDKLKSISAGIQELAQSCGAKFADFSDALRNEQGALGDAYTSDEYVHLNDAGYAVLLEQLNEYAAFSKSAGDKLRAQVAMGKVCAYGHSSPSRKGRILARLKPGYESDTLSRHGAWYELAYEGQNVFVHQDDLLFSGSLALTLSEDCAYYEKPESGAKESGGYASGTTVPLSASYYSVNYLEVLDRGNKTYIRKDALELGALSAATGENAPA